MKKLHALFCLGLLFAVFATGFAHAENTPAIDALIASYPDALSHRDGNFLVWKDGTRMQIDDGKVKTHQQKLKSADIEDMLSQRYPMGKCAYNKPPQNFDPGRIRSDAFFRKLYGNSKKTVRSKLVKINWFGRKLHVVNVNGVNKKLAMVARDLEALPKKTRRSASPSGGTFNWRFIAGTKRLSVHSFGAAIDINTKYADYWRWSGGKPGKVPKYRNRIPKEVVEIFERHGFIWGGKWYHYDTMHFEYRPEILARANRQDCAGE
jgi:hypothetical protein